MSNQDRAGISQQPFKIYTEVYTMLLDYGLQEGFTWMQFKNLHSSDIDAVKVKEGKAAKLSTVGAVGFTYHDETYYRKVKNQSSDGEHVILELGEGYHEKPPHRPIMWLIEPAPGTGYLSFVDKLRSGDNWGPCSDSYIAITIEGDRPICGKHALENWLPIIKWYIPEKDYDPAKDAIPLE